MKLGMLKTAKFLKIWRDKKGPLRTPLMLLQVSKFPYVTFLSYFS